MKTEVEFDVGEYVTQAGARLTVLAAHHSARWCVWLDGGMATYSVSNLRQRELKPYTPPVVMERYLFIGLSPGTTSAEAAYDRRYNGVPVKLTFENGRLVKAEVEK